MLEQIYDEIKFQEALIKGALYGYGDFELDAHVTQLQCSRMTWQTKTDEQKKKMLYSFINFGLREPVPKCVTSTDGELVVPKTQTVAEKPGQKRRIKNAKTVTNKRPRTDSS